VASGDIRHMTIRFPPLSIPAAQRPLSMTLKQAMAKLRADLHELDYDADISVHGITQIAIDNLRVLHDEPLELAKDNVRRLFEVDPISGVFTYEDWTIARLT
jgi:hypothetical protein